MNYPYRLYLKVKRKGYRVTESEGLYETQCIKLVTTCLLIALGIDRRCTN